MAAADPLVNLVTERLEVDVGGIEVGQQVGKGLSTDVASCHKDIIETCLMSLASCIGDVFDISERLGIGIGDARAAMLLTKRHEVIGRKVVVRNFARSDLRDIVVLAVQATEVATRAGDRQALGSRMKMIERLLLDRVNSQCTRSRIDLADEYAVMIATALADARLAVGYAAVVRTKLAFYSSVVLSLIISALLSFQTIIYMLKHDCLVNIELGITPSVPA